MSSEVQNSRARTGTSANKRASRAKPDAPMASLYSLSPAAIWYQVRREPLCFWFACGHLFCEYVRPELIYPAIAILPWSALFALGALVTGFMDTKVKAPGHALSKLIVLYGIVVVISSMFAYDPGLAIEHWDAFFNWVIIYFAITRSIKTKRRYFIYFLLYMLCNFKMTQHAMWNWASRGFAFDQDGVGGSPGWAQNSGEFGIQLCIFTPMIIAFVFAVREYCHPLVRWALYVVPVTAIGSTVASSARAALLGLVASGVWAFRAAKYFLRTAIVVAVLGSAIYAVTPPEFKERFAQSGQDRTSLHRLYLWEKGWETMKEHPVFGVGHYNWVPYYLENIYTGQRGTAMIHNMFLESGTEHGFVGLSVLLLIFLYLFITNHDTRRRASAQGDKFSVYVAHGLDAATIGMAVSCSFVTVLYYPFLWIHAAFVASLNSSVRVDTEPMQQDANRA